MLTPLLFFMTPLLSTLQRMVVGVVSNTVMRTRPSSSRMASPAFTSPDRSLYVMEQRVSSPSISLVQRVNSAPSFSSAEPFLKFFSRTSGPLVSSMAATGRSSSSRRAFSWSSRALWPAWSPWEKLKRATFMPESSISRRTPSRSVAGPRVQTILVFLILITTFLERNNFTNSILSQLSYPGKRNFAKICVGCQKKCGISAALFKLND